jgi:hypothetical protein
MNSIGASLDNSPGLIAGLAGAYEGQKAGRSGVG